MAKTLIIKPLGLVLQKAGLVSPEKVKIALKVQNTLPERRIGEIMALKGWIKPQTADFFAEQWSKLLLQKKQPPLGQYLKQAGLIDDATIDTILAEQGRNGIRFGALAVSQGIIAPNTLNFFLEQLEIVKSQKHLKTAIPQFAQSQHLNQIESHILYNHVCDPVALLNLYRQIWQYREIMATGRKVEAELIASQLVVRQGDKLKIARSHYHYLFDDNWIEQQLARLQPYGRIRLKLFGLETRASLPYKILTEVNSWTNNQPFLTQKLYQIIQQRESFIPRDKETEKIEELVQKYIIDNWQQGVAKAHLSQLQSAILQYQECSPTSLLKIYKKIWQQRARFEPANREQQYLINIGLINEKNGQLSVSNRIYQTIFDRAWIDEQIAALSTAIVIPTKQERQKNSRKARRLIKIKWSKLLGRTILLIASVGAVGYNSKLVVEYLQLKQLRQVKKFEQQQQYQQAVAAYDLLLQGHNSYRDRLWLNRGYALGKLQQYEAMLKSCSAATLIQPRLAHGWNCQGEANYHLKNYRQAVNNFDAAISINSQEPTFWLNKSESLSQLKQDLAAYAANVRAIKLMEQDRLDRKEQASLAIAYNQQGELLLKQQKYDKALAAFEQSLKYDSEYLAARQGKGIAFYELGAYQQANWMFEEILQQEQLSQSQRALTLTHQGINFCYADRSQLATKVFERVLKLTNDPQLTAIAKAGCGIK